LKSITVSESKTLLEEGKAQLLDVRETWETSICCKGGIKIPMHNVIDSMHELDKTKIILVLCKTGRRAEAVANLLCTEFPELQVSFIEGGITRWLQLDDPSFEIY
jgi:rhodanese-related sulfurtransferase